MNIAVRVMANLVTDDDADWVARVWRTAGTGSRKLDRRRSAERYCRALTQDRGLHHPHAGTRFLGVVVLDEPADVDQRQGGVHREPACVTPSSGRAATSSRTQAATVDRWMLRRIA